MQAKPRSYNIRRQRKLVIVEPGEYPAVQRPRTRGDCVEGIRPCPFVSCKHHLYLDVNHRGTLKLNFPDKEPSDMVESCALDVAGREGASLQDVAELMNMTRERVSQIEELAMKKMQLQMRQQKEDHLDPE